MLELLESEWQEVAHAVHAVDFLVAHHPYFHGVTGVFLKLDEGLAAHAAGSAGLVDKGPAGECRHRNALDAHAGIVGSGVVDGAALGADTGKCRVFLVGALDEHAVLKFDGCTHIEVAIGGV